MFKKLSVGLLVCFLFFDIAYGGLNWVKRSYFQNWGGLNDQLSSTEIADGEASDIQNIIFDTGGALKKRYGYTNVPNNPVQKVHTGSSISITGMFYFKKSNGNKYLVTLANSDNKATLVKKDYEFSLTSAWDNIDFVQLPSNYRDGDLPTFTVGEDTLVFTVPAPIDQVPFSWSGTGNAKHLTADTDCPTATICVYHKRHLFLNDTENPSRIVFSELDDITTYAPLDYIDVETSDNSKVRAFVSAYGALYVFKDSSIWKVSGEERDSWILEKMVSGIGTLSQQSIAIVNNYIYFTTQQNDIAIYNGGYDVKFISQKIRNTIGGLNYDRADKTLGLAFSTYKYVDYDYYCSLSSAGASTNNVVLLFDTAYNAWTKFSGINACAWVVAEDNNGQNALYFGDNSGYVYQYPSSSYYDGNVNTSPITAFYQTKWNRYEDVCLGEKYWRRLWTYTASESNTTYLTAECKADQEESGRVFSLEISTTGDLWDVDLWDSSLWGGSNMIINKSEVEKGKNMFQLRFSNSDLNRGFTILGWEIFIEPTEGI